jgi:hypothetical protein
MLHQDLVLQKLVRAYSPRQLKKHESKDSPLQLILLMQKTQISNSQVRGVVRSLARQNSFGGGGC